MHDKQCGHLCQYDVNMFGSAVLKPPLCLSHPGLKLFAALAELVVDVREH